MNTGWFHFGEELKLILYYLYGTQTYLHKIKCLLLSCATSLTGHLGLGERQNVANLARIAPESRPRRDQDNQ